MSAKKILYLLRAQRVDHAVLVQDIFAQVLNQCCISMSTDYTACNEYLN
jgi:hypothetical protein